MNRRDFIIKTAGAGALAATGLGFTGKSEAKEASPAASCVAKDERLYLLSKAVLPEDISVLKSLGLDLTWQECRALCQMLPDPHAFFAGSRKCVDYLRSCQHAEARHLGCRTLRERRSDTELSPTVSQDVLGISVQDDIDAVLALGPSAGFARMLVPLAKSLAAHIHENKRIVALVRPQLYFAREAFLVTVACYQVVAYDE